MSNGLGAYAQVGAQLIERGYVALPIMPGTKRPGAKRGGQWIGMRDWAERRTPTKYEVGAWSLTEAGVCILLGDVLALDLDSDDVDVIDAIYSVIPRSPIRKRGKRGETGFYRNPFRVKSASFRGFADVLAAGRQTLLPPTIHPDTGVPYQWLGDMPLECVTLDELPEFPANGLELIAGALAPFGWEAEADSRAPIVNGKANGHGGDHTSEPTLHRALNDHALQNLDAWIPFLQLTRCRKTREGWEAVADWRDSSTGRDVSVRKLNLKISRNGIRDFGVDQPYTPLDLFMKAAACDLETAFRQLATLTGFGDAPAGDLVIDLKPRAKESISPKAAISLHSEKGEKTEKENPLPSFPEKLTHVPGLLGELVDWITASSLRDNRVLALGTAIGVIGTLVGRRVATPMSGATHLYIATLARSGAGKDYPLQCCTLLLTAAGAEKHAGPSEFMSMSAVVNMLKRKPLALCPMDEIGNFFARILSAKASGFERGIGKEFRKLWGCNFTTYNGPEHAGREFPIIKAPALSIVGASTPGEFYEALSGGDIKNGFLNRWLIISTDVQTPERDQLQTPGVVPEALSEKLANLFRWKAETLHAKPGTTKLGVDALNDPGAQCVADVVPWEDQAARDAQRAFKASIEDRQGRSEKALADCLARTAEIGLRLATIRAVGRAGTAALVSLADVQWGHAVASASAELMIDGVRRHMAENDKQREHKLVEGIIERAGKDGIARSEVSRQLGGRVDGKRMGAIIGDLIEAGTVEETLGPRGKNGKMPALYKHVARR